MRSHAFPYDSNSAAAVLFRVPQGSVAGAILFLLYTADLPRQVESHGLCVHCMQTTHRQIYGFYRPGRYRSAPKQSVAVYRNCIIGRIDCTIMLTSLGFCGAHEHAGNTRCPMSHSWCDQILWHQFGLCKISAFVLTPTSRCQLT